MFTVRSMHYVMIVIIAGRPRVISRLVLSYVFQAWGTEIAGSEKRGMQTVEDRDVDSEGSVCNCFWAYGSYSKSPGV